MFDNNKKGLFITVEGVEGCGKTTNLAYIRSFLEGIGIDLVCTREPGGTPLAEELRTILLANREEQVDELSELLIVFAGRAQHLNKVILPALARGSWVLCDRFTDATYAYQGGGRDLSVTAIEQLESMVQGPLQPDVTFFLDLDVETGLNRARERGELDRFEREQMNFFDKVRQAYLSRIEANPDRFVLIDASVSLEAVQQQLKAGLEKILAGQNIKP